MGTFLSLTLFTMSILLTTILLSCVTLMLCRRFQAVKKLIFSWKAKSVPNEYENHLKSTKDNFSTLSPQNMSLYACSYRTQCVYWETWFNSSRKLAGMIHEKVINIVFIHKPHSGTSANTKLFFDPFCSFDQIWE